MGRIRELDGLRAIAILGVLGAHFVPASTRLGSALAPGWSGVDLFFAISGFLITSILIGLRHTHQPFRTFYSRRTLRIFPPYYLALLLIVGLALLNREQITYREILRHATFLTSVAPNLIAVAMRRLLFQIPATIPADVKATTYFLLPFKDCLGIYWSLSVEELFYLIWAPIVLKGSRKTVLFCSVAPLLVCPVLRGLVHTTPHIGESIGFVFRFDGLAAGSCVALMFWGVEHGYVRRGACEFGLNLTIILSSLGLFAVAVMCGLWQGVDVRTTATFSIFGFSLLAVFCASLVGVVVRGRSELGLVSTLLRSKSAVYVGTISYAIYLVHLPTYAVVQLTIARWFGRDAVASNPAFMVLTAVVATAGTFVLASLSWKYIEGPIVELKNHLFPVRSTPRTLVEQREMDRPDPLCA